VVSEKTLQQWSAELGSDIPFFFSQGTAYCTGRGECVENLPSLPFSKSLFFVKPEQDLSTQIIFKALNIEMTSHRDPKQLLRQFFLKQPQFVNDLETPSFHICPSLKKLKIKLLSSGFEHVFMTGSGTGLICVGRGALKRKNYSVNLIRRSLLNWYSGNVLE